MAVNLSWLVGRCLRSIEKKDFTWFFVLDDKSTISTEGKWRLLTNRVVVTADDDGQVFGLASPVNAAEVTKKVLGISPVQRFEHDERTGDLRLCFENGAAIQFVTLSAGYEDWRIGHGDQQIICLGGGELAIFGPR